MDAELKERWVAALRSGKYPQGRDNLREPEGGFCCLGVLCDLVAPGGWRVSWDGTYYTHQGYGATNPELYRPLGVTADAEAELIDMNDSEEKTFTEIADWIEENL